MLEWGGEGKSPVPLLKDMFANERRKAKVLNFSIAYGKTAHGLSKDWKTSLQEAENTVERWYADRTEVRILTFRTGNVCSYTLCTDQGNVLVQHVLFIGMYVCTASKTAVIDCAAQVVSRICVMLYM